MNAIRQRGEVPHRHLGGVAGADHQDGAPGPVGGLGGQVGDGAADPGVEVALTDRRDARVAKAVRMAIGAGAVEHDVGLDDLLVTGPATRRRKGRAPRSGVEIRIATELGLPLRVGMTATMANEAKIPELGALLGALGISGRDFAVRPLVRRGFSNDAGVEIDDANTVPELTVTTDGVHWHPAGADIETSPDMLLATGEVPLAEAKRLVVERFLSLRQADGSLPIAYNGAV